jgi:hypothetical protein
MESGTTRNGATAVGKPTATRFRSPTWSRYITSIDPLMVPVALLVTTTLPIPGDHCSVIAVLSGKF